MSAATTSPNTRRCGIILPLLAAFCGIQASAQEPSSTLGNAPAKPKVRVLVLCTGNSARSQMSAGYLQSWSPALEVKSAGTNPSPRVNPFAIQAMKEAGIDISSGYPKAVSQFIGEAFDYVITVCDDADKNCPNFRGKVGKRVHIGFPDPAKATGTDSEKLAVFRAVRDDIQRRFREYYESEIRKKI
jgi:arsenate reductase (thioredoxin)